MKTLTLNAPSQTWISIDRSDFDPSHCVRVKSQHLDAVKWSEWSPLVCWQEGETGVSRLLVGVAQNNHLPLLEDLSQSQTSVYFMATVYLVPVCACVGILAWLSVPATR